MCIVFVIIIFCKFSQFNYYFLNYIIKFIYVQDYVLNVILDEYHMILQSVFSFPILHEQNQYLFLQFR